MYYHFSETRQYFREINKSLINKQKNRKKHNKSKKKCLFMFFHILHFLADTIESEWKWRDNLSIISGRKLTIYFCSIAFSPHFLIFAFSHTVQCEWKNKRKLQQKNHFIESFHFKNTRLQFCLKLDSIRTRFCHRAVIHTWTMDYSRGIINIIYW